MSYYLSHRAQDELCEELIKDYAHIQLFAFVCIVNKSDSIQTDVNRKYLV